MAKKRVLPNKNLPFSFGDSIFMITFADRNVEYLLAL
jgi:hypothetical protein